MGTFAAGVGHVPPSSVNLHGMNSAVKVHAGVIYSPRAGNQPDDSVQKET